jgi:hypothetical protein
MAITPAKKALNFPSKEIHKKANAIFFLPFFSVQKLKIKAHK